MNMQKVFVSTSRVALIIVNCCIVVAVVGISNVVCQETKTVRRDGAKDLTISTYKDIPEATEQCVPAECEWWKLFREAGNNLQRKGDEKSKRKFATLFVEGLEQSYRIPLKDRPPQVLLLVSSAPLNPGDMKYGKVVLSVEFRADGSVGEVKVVESLRSDMDKHCIQGSRQNIFLPAIKDGVFVTERQSGGCTFHSRTGIN